MAQIAKELVGTEDITTFRRDGVVCLRNLIEPSWIEKLRDGVETAVQTRGPRSRDIAAEGGKAGRFHNEDFLWRSYPVFEDFIRKSRISDAAAALTGSDAIRLYNDHLLVKEPSTDAPTPWHQDGTYFRVKGDQIVSVWLGLDPVRQATGAMSFVKGSHLWGKMFRPVAFASGKTRESEQFDGPMPDISGEPERYETICYEMEPGDVTFHHALTIHGSLGNTSSTQRRRGYSVRMLGEDVRYAHRPQTSYVIGEGLRDGDPIAGHADFPLLRPA